jgi:hypothetical protein
MNMRLGGRCQRGVRFALCALGRATTTEIATWCYECEPKTRQALRHRMQAVWLAAKRLAIPVGRSSTGKGRPVIWRLKDEDCQVYDA